MNDTREPIVFAKKKKRVEVPHFDTPLCDTHAHVLSFWEKQPLEVLLRAKRAGVEALVTLIDPVGDKMSVPAFREWLRDEILDAVPAGELPRIVYLAGVHPYGAPVYTDDIHQQIAAALDDPLCAGVGEIGLDYHFDYEDNVSPASHEVQMECMARQLQLACERDMPVELHLRHEAADERRTSHVDAYRVLQEVGIPDAGCVLHCFGEDSATLERFCELGCSIAFGGAATFKRNDEVRAAFAACPLDRLLFETDCPYMAPEPIRGLECEPAMIPLTVQALVQDRVARTGEEPAEVVRAAWDNAQLLFWRSRAF